MGKFLKGIRSKELEQAFFFHVFATVQEIYNISAGMQDIEVFVGKNNRKVVAFPQQRIKKRTGIHAIVQIPLDIATEKDMGNQGCKPHKHKYEEAHHAQHSIGMVIDAGRNLVMLTHVDNIKGQLL